MISDVRIVFFHISKDSIIMIELKKVICVQFMVATYLGIIISYKFISLNCCKVRRVVS